MQPSPERGVESIDSKAPSSPKRLIESLISMIHYYYEVDPVTAHCNPQFGY